MTEQNSSAPRESRPDNWPEHYMADPDMDCTHYMMWDDADQQYVCIYECGKTANQPPENKIDT